MKGVKRIEGEAIPDCLKRCSVRGDGTYGVPVSYFTEVHGELDHEQLETTLSCAVAAGVLKICVFVYLDLIQTARS